MANFTDILEGIHTSSEVSDDITTASNIIVITPERKFNAPSEFNLVLGYAGDINSQVVTFAIPMSHESHALELCGNKKILWKNLTSGTSDENDLVIQQDRPDHVTIEGCTLYSWEVPPEAMTAAGTLEIAISFYDKKDGQIVFSWNTPTFKGFTIGESFNTVQSFWYGVGTPPEADEILKINTEYKTIVSPPGYNTTVCHYGDIETATLYFSIDKEVCEMDVSSPSITKQIGIKFSGQKFTYMYDINNVELPSLQSDKVLLCWKVPREITKNEYNFSGSFEIFIKIFEGKASRPDKCWVTSSFSQLSIAPSLIQSDEGSITERDNNYIRNIIKNTEIEFSLDENGIYPIREPGEYIIEVEWETDDKEIDNMINGYSIAPVDKEGAPIMLNSISRSDINEKQIKEQIVIPNSWIVPDFYGIKFEEYGPCTIIATSVKTNLIEYEQNISQAIVERDQFFLKKVDVTNTSPTVKIYGTLSNVSITNRPENKINGQGMLVAYPAETNNYSPDPNTIPLYRNPGNSFNYFGKTITVCTPQHKNDAANKDYVDTSIDEATELAILKPEEDASITDPLIPVINPDHSIEYVRIDEVVQPSLIVRRNANADILVQDIPFSDNAAVNKKYVDNIFARTSASTGAGVVYTNASGVAKTITVGQNSADANSIVQRTGTGTIKTNTPIASTDAANKQYVDACGGEGLLYEQEKNIPYYDMSYAPGSNTPSATFLNRSWSDADTGREGIYDIANIIISGYVNYNGESCYFNQDITRQVQGLEPNTSKASRISGVFSPIGSNSNIALYDFKIDLARTDNEFTAQVSAVVIGPGFTYESRSTYDGTLSNVKIRSILAKKITVVPEEDLN